MADINIHDSINISEGISKALPLVSAISDTMVCSANAPINLTYCAVYVIAKTIEGNVATGTFSIVGKTGIQEVGNNTIVLGSESVTLDTNGYAELIILQGATVDITLAADVSFTKYDIIIPAVGSINWVNL
jgi:hypothetical protein